LKRSRPLRIASVERIRDAWNSSKDAGKRGRSAGVDGVTPYRFRSRLDENIRRLRDRILSPDFTYSSLRPVFIPKKSGADRVICVPTVEDRLVQRLLLEHLTSGDKLKIETPVSYGFRQGLGVAKAVAKARNLRREHCWALKSDISAFFDEIDRSVLKEQIGSRLRNSSIATLVVAAVDTEIECTQPGDVVRLEESGIKSGRGLRQGMPLSPMLSNVVLRDFDLTLHRKGICLVRYADDFVILADSETQCLEALKLVTQLLGDLGHRVPDLNIGSPPKTTIHRPSEAFEFLGFELRPKGGGYEIAIPDHAFEEVKERLKPFDSFDVVSSQSKNLAAAISSINSVAEGFLSVYKSAKNFSDLASHVDQCRKNAANKLMSAIFGPSVLTQLDARRRDFIGIGMLLEDG